MDPFAPVPGIMNGLPRLCLPSGLNLSVWLFALLPSFTAFVVSKFILRYVALLGMFLLLRRHVLEKGGPGWIAPGTALCFALLPYTYTMGFSIAGVPLLLYAFLNIRALEGRPRDYVIIGLFPLCSDLVRAGVFIIVALAALAVVDRIMTGRLNGSFLAGIVLLAAGYAAVEHLMIRGLLSSGLFQSHRAEFGGGAVCGEPLGRALECVMRLLSDGHYSAISAQKYILFIAVPIALLAGFSRGANMRRLLILLGAVLAIALIHGLWRWGYTRCLTDGIGNLRMFQYDRCYYLSVVLWYLIFGLSLAIISRHGTLGGGPGRGSPAAFGRYIALVLLCFQIVFLFSLNGNAALAFNDIVGRPDRRIRFRQFFSPGLFDEIDGLIARPKEEYRVASIGIHPSIAQYNGFHTLDGYQVNYPLSYKRRFRRIIGGELEKSERWKRYFDSWGNRCYIFSAELDDFMVTAGRNAVISDLCFDTGAFREMGGRYLFSAAEITNAADNGFALLRVFENDESPWRIYLYRVTP